MKPIGLRRDNMVLAVHETANRFRGSTRTEPGRSLANPSGTGWPTCWTCGEHAREGQREGRHLTNFGDSLNVPVEAYEVIDEVKQPNGDWLVTLRASCTHGKGAGARVYTDEKTFTFPRTWSQTKRRQRIGAWIAFAPGEALPLGDNLGMV